MSVIYLASNPSPPPGAIAYQSSIDPRPRQESKTKQIRQEEAMKIGFGKSLLFVAALVWADANAQQPAADSVDGHMLAAQKAAGLEFPGLLSHTRRTRKSIDRDRCVLRIEKPIKLR